MLPIHHHGLSVRSKTINQAAPLSVFIFIITICLLQCSRNKARVTPPAPTDRKDDVLTSTSGIVSLLYAAALADRWWLLPDPEDRTARVKYVLS